MVVCDEVEAAAMEAEAAAVEVDAAATEVGAAVVEVEATAVGMEEAVAGAAVYSWGMAAIGEALVAGVTECICDSAGHQRLTQWRQQRQRCMQQWR